MNRSTCVICGKKRIQSSLKKIFGVWVCNIPRSKNTAKYHYLSTLSGSHMTFDECQKELFKSKKQQIMLLHMEYQEEIDLNVNDEIKFHFKIY
jgi:hypothetical protein